jgi:hypothetical protein
VNGELRRPGTGARRILNQTLPTPCQALSPKSFWLGFLDLALVARRGVGRLTEALNGSLITEPTAKSVTINDRWTTRIPKCPW